MRAKQSRSILFLSDLHVGSRYAVCSPNPQMGDGSSHNPNPLQKKLYESWCWVKDSLSTNPHILVLNGEPIDGSNPKQLGEETWSTSIQEQLNDAETLLRMYKPNYFVMTRGSNYHSKSGTYSVEEDLARNIGAKAYTGLFGSKSQE